MTQPLHSGAPLPVSGVTGGPGINQGSASIDPSTGNIVFTPPGNAVEIKKAPSAFNVYEYFNSNADYVRLALQTATGGPEQIGVFAQPTSVSRDLQIVASGNGHVIIPTLELVPPQLSFISMSSNTAIPAGNVLTYLQTALSTVSGGRYLVYWMIGLANGGATNNDYQSAIGNGSFVPFSNARSHGTIIASGSIQDSGFTIITADATGSINLNTQATSACTALAGFTSLLAFRVA